jgi:hypothetical protein
MISNINYILSFVCRLNLYLSIRAVRIQQINLRDFSVLILSSKKNIIFFLIFIFLFIKLN